MTKAEAKKIETKIAKEEEAKAQAKKEKMIDDIMTAPSCRMIDLDFFSGIRKTIGSVATARVKRAVIERRSRLAFRDIKPLELFLALNYIQEHA